MQGRKRKEKRDPPGISAGSGNMLQLQRGLSISLRAACRVPTVAFPVGVCSTSAAPAPKKIMGVRHEAAMFQVATVPAFTFALRICRPFPILSYHIREQQCFLFLAIKLKIRHNPR
jgi:hypothetical protein